MNMAEPHPLAIVTFKDNKGESFKVSVWGHVESLRELVDVEYLDDEATARQEEFTKPIPINTRRELTDQELADGMLRLQNHTTYKDDEQSEAFKKRMGWR